MEVRTIEAQEIKRDFTSFDEANAFWNIQMESIRGYRLRSACLDYVWDFDTKIGKWLVYIRWFPIASDAVVHAEKLSYAQT